MYKVCVLLMLCVFYTVVGILLVLAQTKPPTNNATLTIYAKH